MGSTAVPGNSADWTRHEEAFVARFGAGDVRLFFSPGRVNLMGAHLDYNGGPVMPMAIDRGTFIALRERDDRCVRLASTLEESVFEGELDDLPPQRTGQWFDYPLGVLYDAARRGVTGRGADVLFGGNLPIGAGLSSSASICVGTAFAFDALWSGGASQRDLIGTALFAEREFVGVQCGIMDPFAVTLTRPGHLLWIDCRDESVEHVPLDVERVSIAIADTGVRRELAQGAFNERVSECRRAFEKLRPHAPEARDLCDVDRRTFEAHVGELTWAEAKRARHVIEEYARAHEARAALVEGDVVRFGEQMTAAHRSLRDLFEVSIPELDLLVEAALEHDGVHGTRLTGAGFGGCVVVLLERSACDGLRSHLTTRFETRFGAKPAVEFFQGGLAPCELG